MRSFLPATRCFHDINSKKTNFEYNTKAKNVIKNMRVKRFAYLFDNSLTFGKKCDNAIP